MTIPLEPLRYPGATFGVQTSFWNYTGLEKYSILLLKLDREWIPSSFRLSWYNSIFLYPVDMMRELANKFIGSSLCAMASIALAPDSIVSDTRLLVTGGRDRRLVGRSLFFTVVPVIPVASAGRALTIAFFSALGFALVPIGFTGLVAYEVVDRFMEDELSPPKKE